MLPIDFLEQLTEDKLQQYLILIEQLTQNQLQQYFEIEDTYVIDNLNIKYNLLDPYTSKALLTCKATNKNYINKLYHKKSIEYLNNLKYFAENIFAQPLHIKWHFIQYYGCKKASTIYLYDNKFLLDSNSKLLDEIYFYQENVDKYKTISFLTNKINGLTEKDIIDIYLQVLLISEYLQYSNIYIKTYNLENIRIKTLHSEKKLSYQYYNGATNENIDIITKYIVIFTDFSILTENIEDIDVYRLENFNNNILSDIAHLPIKILNNIDDYYNNDLLINYLKKYLQVNAHIPSVTLQEYQHSIIKIKKVIDNFSYNKLLTRYETYISNILIKNNNLMSINSILEICRLFNVYLLLYNLSTTILLTSKLSLFKKNVGGLKIYIDKLIKRKQKQYELLNNIDYDMYYEKSLYKYKINKLNIITKIYNNIIEQVNLLSFNTM